MIKFFRKIRQKLLTENKLSKYLLYAIGEIILVVIGILLAIQLNTWKNEAEDHANVLKYMDGLHSELIQDYERMELMYVFYSNKTNSIQALLNYDFQNKTMSNDELGELFNSALEYKKFSNKKSTYLSLINDGSINKIKDKQLINEIIKYYESPYLNWSTEIYANISESIDYGQSNIYNSRDRLIDLNTGNSIPNWGLSKEAYQTNYKELLPSKWAGDILSSFLVQSNFIYINLDNYRELNKQLRSEIEHYKGKG